MSAAIENEATETDSTQYECRCCLQSTEAISLYNLFQAWAPAWEGMENTVAEDLCKLANIQINESDKHSNFICTSCCKELQNACHFVSLVRESDRILWLRYAQTKNMVDDKVWPKPIQIDKAIAFDVDIKQEVLSDEELINEDNGFKEIDYNEVEIKVEPEEIVEPPQQAQIHVNGLDAPIPEQLRNGDGKYDEEFLDTKVKEELMSEPEDPESMPTDLTPECILCTKTFNSMSGLKAHVISQHSYKTVRRKTVNSPQKPRRNKYVCHTCKRVFLTSTDLMVHETCHNKEICYGCNAAFDSFEALTEHSKTCKAVKKPSQLKTLDDVQRPTSTIESNSPSEEEKFKCEECNEVFIAAYYMKIHQEVLHSKVGEDLVEKSIAESMEIDALERIFNENE